MTTRGEINSNFYQIVNVDSNGNPTSVKGNFITSGNVDHANVADVANSVSVGNVVGIGNIATINLSGNSSTILLGNGSWSPIPNTANANYANFAGTVVSSSQPNITSLGTLTGLTSSGNITAPYFIGNVQGNIVGNIVVPGANGDVLFNTNGNAAASPNLNFNTTTNTLSTTNLTAGTGNVITLNVSGNAMIAGNLTGVNSISFDIANGPTPLSTGQMAWNTSDGTIDLGMLNGVTQQIGEEQYYYVRANGAIPNGTVVQFWGAQGDHLVGKVANTSNPGFQARYVMGVATQTINNGDMGYVTSFGMVSDLNTYAYAPGTILYLQPNSNGLFTDVEPSAPNPKVVVAAVAVQSNSPSATNGRIFVRPEFGLRLNDLHNVQITTPSNGQALVYNSSSNIWVNGNVISTPGGANTELQFNSNGTFGGIPNVTFSSGNLSLGNIANVKITGGSANYFARTDGVGNLSWQAITSNLTVATRVTAVNIGITTYQMNVEARTGNVVVNVN